MTVVEQGRSRAGAATAWPSLASRAQTYILRPVPVGKHILMVSTPRIGIGKMAPPPEQPARSRHILIQR
jgi:hypothetical protein